LNARSSSAETRGKPASELVEPTRDFELLPRVENDPDRLLAVA
jgi:hypothetical protein